ncbi:MAG: division/cell wall cluster transcriptional repressor MraZ [Flavobacteriales bacterium]|nr:division/cell wall cluster transcriptional repressor MraZ [Flavobacteriales bacterium]|tara:strand:+ start:170 stop:634 length:465 start_codon:yes stop_codon:yes gene_type:complete
MINLIGTYECKVDSKGRVMMPSAIKRQLGNIINQGFVLKRSVFSKCLELHPLSQWESLMSQVNQLNRFVKKNNDFIRLFTAGVKSIDADKNGRIQLPKNLISFAKIKNQVVLSSNLNMIEIWDKESYEIELKNASDDFPDLAEEVMGQSKNIYE